MAQPVPLSGRPPPAGSTRCRHSSPTHPRLFLDNRHRPSRQPPLLRPERHSAQWSTPRVRKSTAFPNNGPKYPRANDFSRHRLLGLGHHYAQPLALRCPPSRCQLWLRPDHLFHSLLYPNARPCSRLHPHLLPLSPHAPLPHGHLALATVRQPLFWLIPKTRTINKITPAVILIKRRYPKGCNIRHIPTIRQKNKHSI